MWKRWNVDSVNKAEQHEQQHERGRKKNQGGIKAAMRKVGITTTRMGEVEKVEETGGKQ